ncbi:hypothetical protein BDY24DRAFT_18376 [Mrakia frigida]|uniref:WD40 repeat domain-containing protein n=1 Tax=Mrakia frigida TaxID=29902 RepID=UPI003FCC11BF
MPSLSLFIFVSNTSSSFAFAISSLSPHTHHPLHSFPSPILPTLFLRYLLPKPSLVSFLLRSSQTTFPSTTTFFSLYELFLAPSSFVRSFFLPFAFLLSVLCSLSLCTILLVLVILVFSFANQKKTPPKRSQMKRCMFILSAAMKRKKINGKGKVSSRAREGDCVERGQRFSLECSSKPSASRNPRSFLLRPSPSLLRSHPLRQTRKEKAFKSSQSPYKRESTLSVPPSASSPSLSPLPSCVGKQAPSTSFLSFTPHPPFSVSFSTNPQQENLPSSSSSSSSSFATLDPSSSSSTSTTSPALPPTLTPLPPSSTSFNSAATALGSESTIVHPSSSRVRRRSSSPPSPDPAEREEQHHPSSKRLRPSTSTTTTNQPSSSDPNMNGHSSNNNNNNNNNAASSSSTSAPASPNPTTIASSSSSRPLSPPATVTNPSPLRNGHLPTNGNGNGNGNGPSPLSPRKGSSRSTAVVPVPNARMYDDNDNEGSSIDRGEFVRIAIQALRDCGYSESALTLEEESGYILEVAPIGEFKAAILGGRWDEALGLMEATGLSGSGWEVSVKFAIAEQEYLELLETSQTKKALVVLRSKLAPLNLDAERLHRLSSFMLCLGRDELLQRAAWDGVEGSSRQNLLNQIQAHIPPNLMIPPRRLSTLFHQALSHQRDASFYYVQPSTSSTLLSDVKTDRSQFPLVMSARLQHHEDEVWNVAWSHSGEFLVSVGKDKLVVVWRIGPKPTEGTTSLRQIDLLHVLSNHRDPVGYLAWSPDDSILLTTAENLILVWNTKTWTCTKTLFHHDDPVTAVRWLPDGSGFFCSVDDGKIYRYDSTGSPVGQPTDVFPLRIYDFDLTPDGKHLLGVAAIAREPMSIHHHSHRGGGSSSMETGNGGGESRGYREPSYRTVMYEVETMRMVPGHHHIMTGDVTNFKLSKDGKTGLVNKNPDDIQLWSFESSEPHLIRHLAGHTQSKFYVRSCFAGPNDNLVISGSEDSNVYVWHRQTGELLEVLSGHGHGVVNAVAWRPDVPGEDGAMFASCGDDGEM